MFSVVTYINVINCFTTDQGLEGRKRKIVLSRSSAKLFGLMSGCIWKIDILSPLKKKPYPAVNCYFSVKCRRAYRYIQLLLMWTQSQTKEKVQSRYSQPFCDLSKTSQFFILKGRTYQKM